MCTKRVALLPGTRTQLQACMDKLKGSFSQLQVNIKYDSLLRCIKARPESRTANVTYIKKYSILNIVIAHFVLS